MANEQNLIPLNKRTKSEQREIARKGGKASAEKRAKAKTSRQIVELLDQLPVTGGNRDALAALGIPDDLQTQQTLRLVALHKKALGGDAAASKLLLEIKGEAPTATLNVEMGDDTRTAYERAAEAIKKKRG